MFVAMITDSMVRLLSKLIRLGSNKVYYFHQSILHIPPFTLNSSSVLKCTSKLMIEIEFMIVSRIFSFHFKHPCMIMLTHSYLFRNLEFTLGSQRFKET